MGKFLILRLAFRELRGGLRGFRIFLACLAIGVAAIGAVGSVSAAMVGGLNADARDILGGDVEFRLAQREVPEAAHAWLAAHGRVSEVHELRGMARRGDNTRQTVVEIKSVDGAYPLYGQVVLRPAMDLGRALESDGIVVDADVLNRLNLAIGDTLRLGEGDFVIRAVLVKEPDRAGAPFMLGPRVIVSTAGLRRAALDRPGSLSASLYRVRLPAGTDAHGVVAAAGAAFPDMGWRGRDFTDAAPSLRGFIDRTGMFLTLVALTGLLVGGVGVGNAVGSHLGMKTREIAILRSLGATSALIFGVYLVQILALAVLGIVLGLALAVSAPWLVATLFGDRLPVALATGPHPGALALAAGFGGLTALGFSLRPLLRVRGVPPAALFREPLGDRRLGWVGNPAPAAVLAMLAGLAIASADQPGLAAGFVVAAAVTMLIFRGAGSLAMLAARWAGRGLGRAAPWLRLAVANLHRPGAPTAGIVLSLGLGLTVLVAVVTVEHSLTREVEERLPGLAPSYFFIDIQPDQVAPFTALVQGVPGVSGLDSVPSLRGRIAAIAGVPAAQAQVDAGVRWAVTSERGLTYAAAPPAGSRVVAGHWWPADYSGPPLISLDAELARGLRVGLGDTITFNIAGRDVTGRIASLRKIDWTTLGINFFTVFSPGALEAAPQTHIATARADGPAAEQALVSQVTRRFPNVSAIRIKDALETLDRVLGELAAAVRAVAAVTILVGLLVLAGAVAAEHRRRLREAVIIKVLGATRGMVLRGFLVEYGLLGLMTATTAAALGTLAGWFVVTRLMHGEWSPGIGRMLLVAGLGIPATLAVALPGTWRALSTRAAPWLRED